MSKTIVSYVYEGTPAVCTGVFVAWADGSVSLVAHELLDAARPAGSPKTWRQIGDRGLADVTGLFRGLATYENSLKLHPVVGAEHA